MRILGLALLAAAVLSPRGTLLWTGAHNQASQMAALLAPAPFKDHPAWCAYASYPDLMRDWGIGHGLHSRWSVSLFVEEAARALREGDAARACFLASAAAHFPQDESVMSHSGLLKMTSVDPDFRILPETLRPLAAKLPVERATRRVRRYARSAEGEVKDEGFFAGVGPPPILPRLFEGVQGFVHDWLEDAAAALALPPERRGHVAGAETLGDHPGWSLKEMQAAGSPAAAWVPRLGFDGWSFYQRWLAAHHQGQWLLPPALFDEASLREGRPRFRDTAGLKAVFAEEFRIALEVTAALYRYVAVRAATKVEADWGALAAEDAKLDALARGGVAIVLRDARADWKRAAEFLSAELECARVRQELKADLPLGVVSEAAPNAHLVTFETSERGPALRIRPRPAEGRVEITLSAKDPGDMGHVLDTLLDEARAPLWSSSPPSAALKALGEVWSGVRLMEDLRARRLPPQELFAHVLPRGKPVPFVHKDEDKDRFAALVRDTRRQPGLHGWLTWWARRN